MSCIASAEMNQDRIRMRMEFGWTKEQATGLLPFTEARRGGRQNA